MSATQRSRIDTGAESRPAAIRVAPGASPTPEAPEPQTQWWKNKKTLLALPVGVWSAVKQYSTFDNVSTVFSTAGVSIPSFWFVLLAILLFSVKLRWLPSGGMYTLGGDKSLGDLLKHMLLPASILSIRVDGATCQLGV